MKKYWMFFVNGIKANIEYRVDIFSELFIELLYFFATLTFWLAVFRDEKNVLSISLHSLLVYYLLVPLFGYLINFNLARSIGDDIRLGNLSKWLLLPIKYHIAKLFWVLGAKVSRLVFILPIYGLILLLLPVILKSSDQLLFLKPELLLFIPFGLGVSFLVELCFGLSAFWVDDVWAFRHFKTILVFAFGGFLFPFVFIPEKVRFIFEALPFKFYYNTPISYLTGKGDTSVSDIALGLVWTLAFSLIAFIFWRRGLKKYDAYGN